MPEDHGVCPAVGADDELFLDDAREGGIVAVPGFVSSLDWPLLLDDRYLRAINVGAERLFDTLLHAYQDTLFFDDIVPGGHRMRAGAGRGQTYPRRCPGRYPDTRQECQDRPFDP